MGTHARKAMDTATHLKPGFEHDNKEKNWTRGNTWHNFRGQHRRENRGGTFAWATPPTPPSRQQVMHATRDTSKPLRPSRLNKNRNQEPARADLLTVPADKRHSETQTRSSREHPRPGHMEAPAWPSCEGSAKAIDSWAEPLVSTGLWDAHVEGEDTKASAWPTWDEPANGGASKAAQWPSWDPPVKTTEWSSWDHEPPPQPLDFESFKSSTWTEPLPPVKQGVPISQLTERNLRILSVEVGEKVSNYEVSMKKKQHKILDWVLHHTEEKPPDLEAIRRRAVDGYSAVRSFWKPFL